MKINTSYPASHLFFLMLLSAAMPKHAPRTRWGGIADGQFPGRGFFRIEQRDGISWLIDPDGGCYLSKGINAVRYDQDRVRNSDRVPYAEACSTKYGSLSAWRAAAAERLAAWGFNTLGSWADDALATATPISLAATPNLDLGMSFAWRTHDRPGGGSAQAFPDVFDPLFNSHVSRMARAFCGARSGTQYLIGWFTDNELRWGPDWRGSDELLILFLNLPIGSPGRMAAIDFLQSRYSDFHSFNESWHASARSWGELAALACIESPYVRKPPYDRNPQAEDAANRTDPARRAFAQNCDDFTTLVAARYFELTSTAIRAADPNHLVLGCRFAYPPLPTVVSAAAQRVDVISFNCYDRDPSAALAAYASAGKPCLIGEFSFRARDSGLPNTSGAGPQVATQAERANSFRTYVRAALKWPQLVGYHWFEHADQPAEGRFDGENSNFGMVTINDCVYEELAHGATEMNADAEDVHAAADTAA